MTDVLTDIPPAAPARTASASGPEPATRAERVRLVVILLVVAAAATWGIRTWLASRLVVTSDNAQVDGHITPIAPKVQAFVSRVLVEDNQQVKAGDTLVVLDARDLQLRLQQAARRPRLGAGAGGQRSRRGPGRSAAGRHAGAGRRCGGHRCGRGSGSAEGECRPRTLPRARRHQGHRRAAARRRAGRQRCGDRQRRRGAAAGHRGEEPGGRVRRGAQGRRCATGGRRGGGRHRRDPGGIHRDHGTRSPASSRAAGSSPASWCSRDRPCSRSCPTDRRLGHREPEGDRAAVREGRRPGRVHRRRVPRHPFKGTVRVAQPGHRRALRAAAARQRDRQLHQGRAARPGADRGDRREDPAHPLRPGMSVDVRIRVAVARQQHGHRGTPRFAWRDRKRRSTGTGTSSPSRSRSPASSSSSTPAS